MKTFTDEFPGGSFRSSFIWRVSSSGLWSVFEQSFMGDRQESTNIENNNDLEANQLSPD